MGCAGHPLVQTPHLDRLAAGGTRFLNAYTNCPICVPARAALATGTYVHQTGNWDNGLPYAGTPPSWAHVLKRAGYVVDSIGKLHFRSASDDNGFTQEIEPLHVVEGIGDPASGIRDGTIQRDWAPGILEAGPGDSSYQQYDRRNRENAINWLRQHAADDKPWVLFLSFVTPHPPFFAPPADYQRYRQEDIALPAQWQTATMPQHPAYQFMRRFFRCEEALDPAAIRRLQAAYYGICSFLDEQIGAVLTALDALNLAGRTRVIYTSDHGEHLGARAGFTASSRTTKRRRRCPASCRDRMCRRARSWIRRFPWSIFFRQYWKRSAARLMPQRRARAHRSGTLPALILRSVSSSPSIMPSARSMPPICCATAATNTSIMWRRRHSSLICRLTRRNYMTWHSSLMPQRARYSAITKRSCAPCSTRKR